jgi:hypothetical protein
VKQIQASSPQPHIDQLKQQAQLFSGETSIPLTSLGVSDMSNPTSADSYIASREDLIAEAEGATDDWGPRRCGARCSGRWRSRTAETRSRRVASIAPKWRSPVYLSRAAQADAGMKQLTAVPWLAETEVGLELLGLPSLGPRALTGLGLDADSATSSRSSRAGDGAPTRPRPRRPRRVAELEAELNSTRAESMRLRIATEHGITDADDIDLFLTGTDEETLTKQAKRLADRDADRKKNGNHVPREGQPHPDRRGRCRTQFAQPVSRRANSKGDSLMATLATSGFSLPNTSPPGCGARSRPVPPSPACRVRSR